MGEIVIGHGLQVQKRKRFVARRTWVTHAARSSQMRRRVLRAAGPEERRACNRARAEFRRRLLGGRSQTQVDVPFQIVWRFGHDVAPQLEKAADIFPRSYSLRQNDTGQAMQPDVECRDHAKVATATTQGPKQI